MTHTMKLKFKRIAGGLYHTEYKGFKVEVSKNDESRNWSMEVRNSKGSMICSDVCYTYYDAKIFAEEIIDIQLSK